MGMFMVSPPASVASGDAEKSQWEAWENLLEDSRAHGMTSLDPLLGIPLKEIKDGKAVVDFTAMDRFMELAKAAGFKKELCGYGIQTGLHLYVEGMEPKNYERFGVKSYGELVKAYFDAVREHAKEKGWLPVCYNSDDEYLVHAGASFDKYIEHHSILRKSAPDIRFADYDSIFPDEKPGLVPTYEKMLAQVDTWASGLHSPKLAEMVRKAGKRLWLYNTGMNRFTFGTYMFYATKKYGVKGFFQWIYNGGGTLSNFDLASHRESFYGVAYPSSRGLRTTIIWERIRAGCDDHRYLQTAWERIAAAKASGKNVEAAKALEAQIEQTFAKLTFGKVKNVDAESGEGKADNPLSPAGMAALRKTLAEGILKLQP